MLTKGRLSGLDLKRYFTGGAAGAGGLAQLGKSVGMRFGFVAVWNCLSSNKQDLHSLEEQTLALLLEK